MRITVTELTKKEMPLEFSGFSFCVGDDAAFNAIIDTDSRIPSLLSVLILWYYIDGSF